MTYRKDGTMHHRTGQRVATALLLALLTALTPKIGASDFLHEFTDNYELLGLDLLNNPCEVATVTDFVYQKDVATFTFRAGQIFLLRYIDDRPNTAIFIGDGAVTIDVPVPVERQFLRYVSGDSLVNQRFEVCVIRMADDFDLRIREKFPVSESQLVWKEYNMAKKAQGELFFWPVIQHTYDNFFQLLRSVYERKADGYFWADFGRYVYSFDPNRAEGSVIGYEQTGGGDLAITEAAVMQRRERMIDDNRKASQIAFAVTMTSVQADLFLGGMQGDEVESARTTVALVVNADSVRFLSLWLHHNLKIDSMRFAGAPLDYYRRKDFSFTGIILPAYRYRGDTVTLELFYHGRDYDSPLPAVEDPSPATVAVRVNSRKGYNYVFPGMSDVTMVKGGLTFTAEPQQPFRQYRYQGYASGYDTIRDSSGAAPITFLKSRSITKNRVDCFVPDEQFRGDTRKGYDFFTGKLGPPYGVFDLTVFPTAESGKPSLNNPSQGDAAARSSAGFISIPGLVVIPQVLCQENNHGNVPLMAGRQLARQWFGGLLQPVSERELWVVPAVAEYLALMYVQDELKGGPFYNEMLYRRSFIYSYLERNWDMPLAVGKRIPDSLLAYKGAWVMHMLRMVMLDPVKRTDQTFWRFLRELSLLCNTKRFSNADVIALAEKHAGQKLDWFFDQWLFGRNIPEFAAQYDIVPEGDQFAVNMTVRSDKVAGAFRMPVLLRVEFADGSSEFVRQYAEGNLSTWKLGPFSKRPKEVHFNEFYSVLSRDNVKKQS